MFVRGTAIVRGPVDIPGHWDLEWAIRDTHAEVSMRTPPVSIPVFALLSTLFAGASHAGVRWELEYQGSGPARTTTVAIEGKKVRVERPTGTGDATRVILYDAATGKVVMLDTGRATYRELVASTAVRAATPPLTPEQEFDRMLTPEQRARIANATPEERAMIEAALRPAPRAPGAAAPPSPPRPELAFERPGTRETVSGRACDVLRVSQGGQLLEDDCTVAWGAGSLTRDEVVVLGKLALTLDPTGRADPTRNPVPDFSKYPGFPLERKVLDARGTVALTYTVLKLERARIPATSFEIPANYALDTRPLSELPSP